MPILFDAARGKPVQRISIGSPSSGRVNAFVTSRWVIDLGRSCPIHAIKVHNATSRSQPDIAHVAVSISGDQHHWDIVRSGLHYFTNEKAPLGIQLGGRYSARHVCLELPHRGASFPYIVNVLTTARRLPTLVRKLGRFRRWLAQPDRDPARHGPALVDMALQGTATQSSSGTVVIDLHAVWPISRIRIHGCLGRPTAAAPQVNVSISRDTLEWERVHEGLHAFGDGGLPCPLDVWLRNKRAARFVRLELPGEGRERAGDIEVSVEQRLVDFRTACAHYGFRYEEMLAIGMHDNLRYALKSVPASYDGRIDSFHLTRIIGRFGNNVRTMANAICLARRCGVRRLYLPHLSQLEINAPIEADGVTVLHERRLAQDHPGVVLAGPFFYRDCFGDRGQAVTAEEFAWAIRAFVRPIFESTASSPPFALNDGDLAVHIRSGDIFSRPNPHTGYVQPPLSFYQLVIGHAVQHMGVPRVILVSEDELNPCIPALKEWLRMTGLPFVAQSGTLAEDIAVLRSARSCVFGHGSFGPAIAYLSDRLETVFLPWTVNVQANDGRFPGVRIVQVRDVTGQYTKPGTWRASPEQLRTMLEYPIESLALEEVPSGASGPLADHHEMA